MMEFPALSPTLRAELTEAVGSPAFVDTSESERIWASADAAGSYRLGSTALQAQSILAVVRPGSTEEVAAVIGWARRHGIALIARGSGTGVMGAAIPLKPAVAVEMRRFNQIRIDAEDFVVEAGSGTILADVNEAARPFGAMLGHDPWSVGIASVGGAINTDGMGYMAGRWGSMGEQVAGLEAVLGDGTIVASPPIKASMGPDWRALFIGSQGMSGIVTRAWLRLVPLPRSEFFRCFRFRGFESGFHAIIRLWQTGLRYDLLDFTDGPPETWDLPTGLEDNEGRTAVLYLASLGEPEESQARMDVALRILSTYGEDLGPERARRYWLDRHAIAEEYARTIQGPRDWATRQAHGLKGLDYLNLALPPHRILAYRRRVMDRVARDPNFVAGETGIWCRPEVFSLVIAEAGALDWNTRVPGKKPEAMERLMTDLLTMAVEEGGNIECIHGPGLKLLPLVARDRGPQLPVMRAIKQVLDPDGLLNPGKLP